MKPTFLFLSLMIFSLSGTVHADEGIASENAAPEASDFNQWESEFKSSLDTLSKPSPTSSSTAVANVPAAAILKKTPKPQAARLPEQPQPSPDVETVDGNTRVDRVESRVAQLERSLRLMDERLRMLDREVDDLKRRR